MSSVRARVDRLERRLGPRIRLELCYRGEPLPEVEARPGERVVFVCTGVPRRPFDGTFPRGAGRGEEEGPGDA